MQAREAAAGNGAVRPPLRLRTRADFLRVATGRKAHAALFTVQMRFRDEDGDSARVGLTVTRKVGSAVERNRIRRRLREVLRLRNDLGLRPQHDYVIVARRDLLSAPFPAVAASLTMSVTRVHGAPSGSGKNHRSRS